MSTPQSMTPDAEVSASAPAGKENGDAATNSSSGGDSPAPAATSSSRSEPVPFVYDPDKTSLKFIFANRDGLHVILDCKPADTIGEVKGALLSLWPEGKRQFCLAVFSVALFTYFITNDILGTNNLLQMNHHAQRNAGMLGGRQNKADMHGEGNAIARHKDIRGL
mmetsp:Transcript_24882/g.47703  ORF Transcript_24882/g.47703 Transcript_24882/m.47703 type:complete len:165 (-) Transcript_24882:479-973(-)